MLVTSEWKQTTSKGNDGIFLTLKIEAQLLSNDTLDLFFTDDNPLEGTGGTSLATSKDPSYPPDLKLESSHFLHQ